MRNIITTVAVCVAILPGCSDQPATPTTPPTQADQTKTSSPPEADAAAMSNPGQSLGGERERLIDQPATSTMPPTQADQAKTGSAPEGEAAGVSNVEQSLGGERERLIARLVARGDRAMTKDQNLASRYYSFASLYAPNDDDIKMKLAEAEEGSEYRLPDSQGYTN